MYISPVLTLREMSLPLWRPPQIDCPAAPATCVSASNCYAISNDNMTHEDALGYCASIGLMDAGFKTQEDLDIIKSALGPFGEISCQIWLSRVQP